MNIDFRTLQVGDTIPFREKSLEMKVSEITIRPKGWVRILATLDGLKVILHRDCRCERPDGEILALDLVTESEYLCCTKCRRLVND